MEYIFSNNENKQLLASPTFRIETNNLLPPTIVILFSFILFIDNSWNM